MTTCLIPLLRASLHCCHLLSKLVVVMLTVEGREGGREGGVEGGREGGREG